MRKDFLDKLSHNLVSRFNTIVVEGFDVADLVSEGVDRSKRRREILDGAWGELRRQLGYKARWRGRDLLLTDKFESTDQACHLCGTLNKMPPTTSRYACPCGLVTTRQENTARLLESFGGEGAPDQIFGPRPEGTRGDRGSNARREGPDKGLAIADPSGIGNGVDGSAAFSEASNQPRRNANGVRSAAPGRV